MTLAKYYIYRNLNSGTAFSVKHRGKVIYRGDLSAKDVTFKVSKAGRARCLTQKKRNVHAYAVAETFKPSDQLIPLSVEVWYNPYKTDRFMCQDVPVTNSKTAHFVNGKCYINP